MKQYAQRILSFNSSLMAQLARQYFIDIAIHDDQRLSCHLILSRLYHTISALGNTLPIVADFDRLLALCLDPLPAIRSQRYPQRDLLARGHTRALDELNHPGNGLVGITRLIANKRGFKLSDTGIELSIVCYARLNMVNVREDLGLEVARLDNEDLDARGEDGQLFGKTFDSTCIESC